MTLISILLTALGVLFSAVNSAKVLEINPDNAKLSLYTENNLLQFHLDHDGVEKLTGHVPINLRDDPVPCSNELNCWVVDNDTKLYAYSLGKNQLTLNWISTNPEKVLKTCWDLKDHNWYGGPEQFNQLWPIEKLNLTNYPNVLHEKDFAAVSEPYWLSSEGYYIYFSYETPLFIDQNSEEKKVCFSAKLEDPYINRNEVILHYTIGFEKNVREAHLNAVRNFLGKPTGHPNPRMIERPIWSTWARYKRDINDTLLREFAQDIVDNGYADGQFEIDDDWEICYGALDFNERKFGEINQTVKILKELGFRVTLWIHPFVNIDCENYTTVGRNNEYFVKNTSGSVLTQWWNSKTGEAQYLDFTKPVVRELFVSRLRYLQEKYGIDSFKFDAGESSWPPQISFFAGTMQLKPIQNVDNFQPPILKGDIENSPNNIVSDYVRTCATLGDLIEVRTAWRTQDLPVFVRMIDKDSRWGSNNGLYTLITTLLQMNMNGYPFVLPDMIGGNGYIELPTAELFVRWLQANTFMPSIQFSYVPWDYKDHKEFDVMAISRKYIDLHKKISKKILEAMRRSVERGHPVNPPIWWIAPEDPRALKEDTEFLLGEDILIAPVIEEGARSRIVYLPKGKWIDGNDKEKIYEGPLELNYSAPIDVLPHFYLKK